MAHYRYIKTLLEVDSGTSGVEGDAYAILPSETDIVPDTGQGFRLFLEATQAGIGGVDLLVETSPDGETWYEVATLDTPLAEAGSVAEFQSSVDLGPYVRASSVLTGSPSDHAAKVRLASSAPFRITAV